MPSTEAPGRRAPLAHYALSGIVGVVIAAAVGAAVAATNDGDTAAFLITALAVLYPATALGGRIFVTDLTVAADRHGMQSVEVQWLQRAGAGAFAEVPRADVPRADVPRADAPPAGEPRRGDAGPPLA